MAKCPVTKLWFVSVEMPRQRRPASAPGRQTKTFPTDAEARQFAKDMLLSERKNIIASTLLSADQPARRIVSGSQLYRWIEEEKS
jgi:hypothetical protein